MKYLKRFILLILISIMLFANYSFAQESDEPEENDIPEATAPSPTDSTEENTTTPIPETTPPVEQKPENSYKDSVTLQGLNKITTKVSTINVKKNEVVKFGNLEISLLSCWKAPADEAKENKALLKIWEQIPGEDKKVIFSGWMFSSSPSISALENAVYDVTVIECTNSSN